ncbi:MAG: hypothetical protein H0V88_10340 [Pyrinomonadaceae bacterium]|nr:hypothetical protein [Pyrinomonadaceae bacterium]
MIKLRAQGWRVQTVAVLMNSTRATVRKWVRDSVEGNTPQAHPLKRA